MTDNLKCDLLRQIDNLKSKYYDNDFINSLPLVDINSSYEEIKLAHIILQKQITEYKCKNIINMAIVAADVKIDEGVRTIATRAAVDLINDPFNENLPARANLMLAGLIMLGSMPRKYQNNN